MGKVKEFNRNPSYDYRIVQFFEKLGEFYTQNRNNIKKN